MLEVEGKGVRYDVGQSGEGMGLVFRALGFIVCQRCEGGESEKMALNALPSALHVKTSLFGLWWEQKNHTKS